MAMLAAVLLAGLAPAVPAFGENLPPLATLQLSATTQWTDGLGTYHVVGEVTNGDAALTGRFIKVACTIHDQTRTGSPAVTTFAYTEADLLGAPASHDPAACTVSGVISHAVPNHDFAVAVTSVTTGSDGVQQVKGTITNGRNASVAPVKLMLTYYGSLGVPVDETSHYLTTNASSSLGPLQQVAFTFERIPPPQPGGPIWSYAGSASIGSLAEAPAPTTDVSPALLPFSPQIDLIPSAPQTVTVSNIGARRVGRPR